MDTSIVGATRAAISTGAALLWLSVGWVIMLDVRIETTKTAKNERRGVAIVKYESRLFVLIKICWVMFF